MLHGKYLHYALCIANMMHTVKQYSSHSTITNNNETAPILHYAVHYDP